MEILTYEIGKAVNNADYLNDRLAAAKKRSDMINSQIQEIPPRIAARQAKLRDLKENRKVAAREYEKLKDQKKELESRLEVMPSMQDDINKLLSEVGKLSQRLRALRARHSESLSKKEKLDAEVKSIHTKLNRIEEEINISKSTKELLLGSRPEKFDADVFEEIQSDVGKNVESFEKEMKGQIENLKRELSSIQMQFERKTTDKGNLLKRKKDLLASIESLRSLIGEDIGKQDLVAEIENLTNQQRTISLETKEKQLKTRQEKEALKSTEIRINQEEILNNQMSERHSHLISVRQEMADIENVAEKMKSLENEIQKLKLDTTVNGTLRKTLIKLNEATDPTKRKLRSALQYCEGFFSDFEREIINF
jgi:chromosome segregation ATPase